jgi:hypothetical protein
MNWEKTRDRDISHNVTKVTKFYLISHKGSENTE